MVIVEALEMAENHQLIIALKKDLDAWISHIGSCDGINPTSLRLWLEKLQNAKHWLNVPDHILIPKVVSIATDPQLIFHSKSEVLLNFLFLKFENQLLKIAF